MSNATGHSPGGRPAMQWRPVGPDGRTVDLRVDPRERGSIAQFPVVYLSVYFVFGRVAAVSFVYLTALAAAFIFLLLPFAIRERMWVRTDAHGVTVPNRFRTHRVRWADIDDVALDGYDAITLLTRDRVISCAPLRCAERQWLPVGRAKRERTRSELHAVRDWMLATSRAALAAERESLL